MVNDSLNFSEILKKCGVGAESPDFVLKKIEEYLKLCTNSQVLEFILYILYEINDAEILYGVIKISDYHRDSKILSRLLELLLLKNVETKEPDEFINVRVIACKAIANYKDTSTLGTLLYCLNNKDENYKVRLACADALGRIGDRYAVEPLLDVVKDEDEKSIYVKESATFALGLLGDVSAIEPLIDVLEAKQGLLGKFSFLKERIVEALGKLNFHNKRVLDVLKKSLYDTSPIVRINTIEALMNSDFEEASDLIRIALKDEDDEVKRNAMIALYNMQGRDILDEILSLPGYDKFLKLEAKNLIEEYEEL